MPKGREVANTIDKGVAGCEKIVTTAIMALGICGVLTVVLTGAPLPDGADGTSSPFTAPARDTNLYSGCFDVASGGTALGTLPPDTPLDATIEFDRHDGNPPTQYLYGVLYQAKPPHPAGLVYPGTTLCRKK